MDQSDQATGHAETPQLRQRLAAGAHVPETASSADAARETVLELNTQEEQSGKDENGRRTYGRTPDQKVFIVPQTHDMVSQLLSPTQPKNISDFALLAVLGSFLLLLWKLPTSISIPIFGVFFLFWRAMYNAGIGWLLYKQSNYRLLVQWARKYKIFQNPATGEQPRPLIYKFLKREFEAKISRDYKFEDAPIEYNTWLLFRRFVDLVLLCDFVCYCCFAVACSGRPHGEHVVTTILRWFAGIILFLFNVWVKLDAHRVVKDYAWYWGDFFFLVDQQLTFDGVFEMAPHPMYSVGYAGFYGISLMAASYRVLFISIIGHAAQFVFLALVENPHIDKTYNTPPPRLVPATSAPSFDSSHHRKPSDSQELEASIQRVSSASNPTQQAPYIRNLIGIDNMDFHRVIDVSAILLQLYLYTLAILTPSTLTYQIIFVVNAAIWRLWYAVGIGYILIWQSRAKRWTRHFIKYGESTEEAWRQWKGIYHISMTMCYASFIAAAFKMYTIPPDWSYGMATLRHTFGIALILLQFWTISSIYESLGEFGWFYGDFFFDQRLKLTYSGIYRYLNNPERVIGLAGVWGVAAITWSKAVFFLALLSHTSSLAFIHFVERPHMEKRYGQSLRQESGVSKTFQRSLPRPFRNFQGSVDRVLVDTVDIVEDFIESARPKLAAGYETFVKDTMALFKHYPARLSIMRLTPDMAGFDPKDYTLEIDGTLGLDPSATADKFSGREGDVALTYAASGTEAYKPVVLEYGAPIRVRWKAPSNHSKNDWLGLYMVADNASRFVTSVPAQGRWMATNPGIFDSMRADEGILKSDEPAWRDVMPGGASGAAEPCLSGEVEFEGDKLWWTTGVFEVRYHHNGSHTAMAISRPFEIRIPALHEDDVEVDAASETVLAQVEQMLLPLVQNCFDRDPKIAPSDVEEPFGSLVERNGKFAKRVVFGVRQMFGIEFAPQVVRADGTVRNIAWRICNAKQVLAPYSMSRSRGTTTPTEAKD